MISYVRGDATRPTGEGVKIIIHIVNSVGAWGAGFVLAISKRWMKPERFYRHIFQSQDGVIELGSIQITKVDGDIYVVNMVAQKGLPSQDNRQPLDYGALSECLSKLNNRMLGVHHQYSIHCPRIGTGYGGGNWHTIENILAGTIGKNFDITVYDP